MKKRVWCRGADDLHDPREPTSWLQRRREGSGGVQDDGRPPSVLSLRATSQTSDRGASAAAAVAARAGNKGSPAHDMQRSTAKATTKEQESPMVAGGEGGGGGRGDTPGFAPDHHGVAAAAGHRGRRARRGGGCGCGRSVVTQPNRPSAGPSPPSPPAQQTVEAGSRTTTHHAPPSSATQSPALPAAQAGPGGGGAHQILKDGVGGRLSAGLPQICFPPSPTLSVIDFGAWRAQDTPSQPCTRCEDGLRDPREASVSPPAEASVDEGCGGGGHEVLFLRARPSSFVPLQRRQGPLSLQLLLRDWQQFLGAEKRRDQSTVSREGNGNGKRKNAETPSFSTPPGGGGRSKRRGSRRGKGKDTMKGGVVKRMVHDLQDGPCVSLPRRGCKASANDALVAEHAKPSRRWSSLAHHPLEPSPPAPACSAHNAPPSPRAPPPPSFSRQALGQTTPRLPSAHPLL